MAGVDGLVAALKKQVLHMEDDLRARVDGPDPDRRQAGVEHRWRAEHQQALRANRTAASWQEWRDERVTQVAVAWVLLTVFARYCEDNRLVSRNWIGGPDADTRREALDARHAYFVAHLEHTDRDWLLHVARHFAKFDATAALVDDYSPLHQVGPSGDAARALLEFWWGKDDAGEALWRFAGVDTRFLGDVYQDLSDHAKKTYALLQTPVFVEEFILDHTLEPALAERPLEGFTVIDPTCGSGHFLLGAFARLHERWQRHAPALGARELTQKALASVFGVDINPFAVAIARFRLLVAAMEASGDTSLEQNVGYTLNLATGDSLIWGAKATGLTSDELDLGGLGTGFAYTVEDAAALRGILQREHDVVVGNPPYITVKDQALNGTYRQLYSTCHRQYALTVPFMELFFDLAHVPNRATGKPAGWTGQITSNSFMKREFGTKLIEDFLAGRDLRQVIDTSGAYIPGHGTPTVIIVGRNQAAQGGEVRAVLGVRGEPGRPDDPAKGIVWTAIVEHVDQPGWDNGWITVTDLDRATLKLHPWNLTGGGAVELAALIEQGSKNLNSAIQGKIGFASFPGTDDAFFAPKHTFRRLGWDQSLYRQLVLGEYVRDWEAQEDEYAFAPYDNHAAPIAEDRSSNWYHRQWMYKTTLEAVTGFGGERTSDTDRPWWTWYRWVPARYRTPLSITFAFVATHNHFVLDRGGKVFNRSAPVVKLPEGATVEEHLRLLGVLNSSTGCFWLKQNSHDKGSQGINEGAKAEAWERFYEFTGTTLKDFPLPAVLPLDHVEVLDTLAQELAAQSPAAVCARTTPTAAALAAARAESARLRALMVAHQEELDWQCYRLYGLTDEDLTSAGELPGVELGERAFEITLARAAADGAHTAWFDRHRSTPRTDIPPHLPADYRALVQRRLDATAANPHLRLLEKPEYKRRWSADPWDKRATDALKDWLLDRVEDRALWFDRDGRPTPRSTAHLAETLDRDDAFTSVLRLWAGNPNASTAAALAALLADEAVPYLAAYRHTAPGLRKREAWEHTWELQRKQDAGQPLDGPIPVPPKYAPADFAKQSFWARRGKLDVPKERFVAYPGANRDSDPSALLGWAGWDHAEQALALANLLTERADDGWDPARLTPLAAGLAELLPWVRQWHADPHPDYGASMAEIVEEELRHHLTTLRTTEDELRQWRTPAPARGRRRAKEA